MNNPLPREIKHIIKENETLKEIIEELEDTINHHSIVIAKLTQTKNNYFRELTRLQLARGASRDSE